MREQSQTSRVLIGESLVGDGAEVVHINTVLGDRDGPVGTAWATALAMPRPGHSTFVAVLQPNLPVKPLTLFVNKAAIAGAVHQNNRAAARAVLESGAAGEDEIADMLAARHAPANPFFTPQ